MLKKRSEHLPYQSQLQDMKLKPAGAQKIEREGIRYDNRLRLARGRYNVHFVVRNNLTGAIGSVWAPLEVRD